MATAPGRPGEQNPAYAPCSAHPQLTNSERRVRRDRVFCSLRERAGEQLQPFARRPGRRTFYSPSTRGPRLTSARFCSGYRLAATLDMLPMVGVAELRENLSKYLRRVERGGRLLVTDRNRLVA